MRTPVLLRHISFITRMAYINYISESTYSNIIVLFLRFRFNLSQHDACNIEHDACNIVTTATIPALFPAGANLIFFSSCLFLFMYKFQKHNRMGVMEPVKWFHASCRKTGDVHG